MKSHFFGKITEFKLPFRLFPITNLYLEVNVSVELVTAPAGIKERKAEKRREAIQ